MSAASVLDEGLAEVARRLRERSPLPALSPPKPWTPWDPAIHARLTNGDLAAADPRLRAGLLLWNDDLAEAHTLSQGLAGPDGAYWHAIMHRREGDLDNAGYWFGRVGAHPVFVGLHPVATGIASAAGHAGNAWAAALEREWTEAGAWDPLRFLALCADVREVPGPHPVLERIQVAEIELLLRHCGGGRAA